MGQLFSSSKSESTISKSGNKTRISLNQSQDFNHTGNSRLSDLSSLNTDNDSVRYASLSDLSIEEHRSDITQDVSRAADPYLIRNQTTLERSTPQVFDRFGRPILRSPLAFPVYRNQSSEEDIPSISSLYDGKEFEICPSKIRFSQDEIFYKFRAQTPQSMKKIKDVLLELERGSITVESFPPIRVTLKDNLLYSLDNRRLWVFKEYQKRSFNVKILVSDFPTFTIHN